ncbi:2-keto-4-pentenoate hydratase [Ramlibacter sp. PS4R-6]|uniref:2-keto-4-pentenoate hydratase n=1 Tax=Ramlibacter sp. PS4R-6 TaxID=3133438 RepID=UPI00309D0B25
MTKTFDAAAAAHRLVSARMSGTPVASADVLPPDRAGAFAVQDATVAALGAVGGWKVGAKGPAAEPGCAPLPAAGLVGNDAVLTGPGWRMRGIEVEVAVRFARDFIPAGPDAGRDAIVAALDCVLPAIEVVETRLADWRESDPLAQLADLQTHGALVLGAPSSVDAAGIDLRAVQAYLAFDGQPVATTRGGNTAGDIWRLLGWVAWQAVQRGRPLRAGDVVTTGSCTGMLFAGSGSQVVANLAGIGDVQLRF